MANIYDTLIEQERQTTGITPTQASSNSSNIYDDIIIKERSDAQQYRSAVMEAVKTSPDRAAQVQKISKELLLPTAVVDRNMDDLDRLARARRLELLRAANDDPVLARQLSDSEFAKIAQDDTDNLSFTGKVFKFFRDTVTDAEKGFKSGRITNEMGFLGERAMVGQADKAMWKRIADLREKQKQLKGTGGFVENAAQLIGQQFDTVPEVMHFGAQAALAGGTAAAIAGQLGPQIATPEEIFTVPTAAIGAFFAGSAAKMGEQTYRIEAGSAYVDMLESGIDKDVAVYSSAGVGLVNAALELTGMHFIAAPFKKLLVKEATQGVARSLTKPTMRAAVRELGKDYIGAILGETSTEVLQEVSNVIGEEIGRSMSDMQNLVETEEGRKQIADRLTGIFEQVTKGMALLAIPGAGLHFRTEVKRVKDAEKNGTFFDSLSKGIDTSKVLERNPDAYHSFISNQAADAQVENIYIDGKVFAQTLNQHGIKAEELDQVVPGLSEKVQDAALTGGDVVMSTADYATHLAKADLGKAMLPHVRTDASALSVAEASQAGNLAQQLLKGADGILAKNEERKEWIRSANEVQKTMFDQIKSTGAYSDTVSRLYASTVKAFYVNLADRNNSTPMEEYQKNPYKVEMGELNKDQSGITYNQEGKINIDENFKNWFGESKVVGPEGKPLLVYHGGKGGVTVFDPDKAGTVNKSDWGKGVYFTPSEWQAAGYKEDYNKSSDKVSNALWDEMETIAKSYGTSIMGASIDLRNGKITQEQYDNLNALDRKWREARRDAEKNGDGEVYPAYLKIENPEYYTFEGLTDPFMAEKAKSNGKDGIIITYPDGGIDEIVVFSPTQIKSVNNRGTFDPNNPNILMQSAWHGSPHTFDKFSTSAIGTGEGAQAYGYGLYFAGAKDVAEYYKNALSRGKVTVKVNGVVRKGDNISLAVDRLSYRNKTVTKQDVLDYFNERIQAYKEAGVEDLYEAATLKEIEKARKQVDGSKSFEVNIDHKQGRLYKVELAPAEDEYLLWDKPLSEQSEKVREALVEVGGSPADIEKAIALYAGRQNIEGVRGDMAREEIAKLQRRLDNANLMTGEELYRRFSQESQKGDRAASEYLHSLGIRGIKYEDGNTRNKDGEKNYNYVIFSDDDVAIQEMYQKMNGRKRGGYDPSRLTTILTQDTDYSTFLHETGHFFLDTYSKIASDPNAPAAIKEDMQTILNWFGIESLEAWNAMDLEQQRQYHEQFAYNFEIWVAEGKSPSIKMESVFRAFGRFLKQVYENIRDELNDVYRQEHGTDLPILTGEVRQVMERMLASEQQIKESEQVRAMAPIFDVKPESMTDEEWAAYQELQREAHDKALDEHTRASLRSLKWLEGARSKFLKTLQNQVKDIRKAIGQEVAAEVQAEPVYRAINFMKTGEFVGPDGTVIREDGPHKLSIPALKDMYPELKAEKEKKIKPPKLRSLLGDISKAGGITYDSLVRSLDANEVRGAKGGNRFMAITGRKGRGWGMDQMADMMQDQGWVIPTDADGNINTDAFAQMVKDAVNGNKPIHPDDVDIVASQEQSAAQSEEDDYLGALVDYYNQQQIDQGHPDWKQLGYGNGGMLAEDGMHPDLMAGLFGFHGGDELVRTLLETAPMKTTIQGRTDRRMLEEHDELSNPDAMQEAVDRAIHNEIRAKFIGVELRHLAKSQQPVRVMQEAARRAALQILEKMQLKNIRPQDFMAAEAKASRAADTALRKGDIATATASKEQQLLQNQLAAEALKAKEQIKKDLKYLEGLDKDSARKKMGPEAAEQIDMLLEKVDLKPPSMKQAGEIAKFKTWVKAQLNQGVIPDMAVSLLSPEERRAFSAEVEMRDEEGNLVYKEDEDVALLLADAIDRSSQRPYYEMSIDEWQGLVDTIRNIHHIGKAKTMMIAMADGLSYEQVRDEIASSIAINAKNGGKNTRTANDWLGKKIEGLRQFGAAHIKVATWARIMDGGKDNGPVWRFFVQTANERASWETSQRAEATEKLAAILAPVLKKVSTSDKVGKGKFFPSIGESLNWEARMAIAMNYGNDSNLQRLLDGMGWSIEQIMPVLSSLTMEEWKAAEAIGQHFESYRPQIAEKEKRVNGKEPKWIEPREFAVVTADGQRFTSKGWYYPVVFDPRLSLEASQHASAEDAKNQMKAAYNVATTRRSFVKERAEKVVGRPLLLSLQGMYSGVNDVIHDLAWHEWVIDANKLLRSKSIDNAIREYYGPEVKREFEKWRDDIVAGTRRLDHAIEKAAGFFRQSVSFAGLAFNVVSALMQPFGLINSGVRVGHKWIGHGVARYASNPVQATRDAKAKSAFMENRTRTRFRELNELRNQIQGQTAVKELMGRYGYWMMMQTQQIVDVITWHAAYDKAIAEGLFKTTDEGTIDDRTAVNIADQAVKDAQGGGEELDQAGVERGGPMVKLFTTFYSFMATTLNVAYLEGKTEKSKAKAAVNMLLVLSVQPLLGSLLKDAVTPGGDDDDPEKIAKKLAAEQISFLLGTVAFGREFAQMGRVIMGEGKGMGYSGPPGLRAIADAYKLAGQARQGEFDVAFAKAFVNVLGDTVGIPSVQINRAITGAKALSEGNTKNPAALIMGYQKQ